MFITRVPTDVSFVQYIFKSIVGIHINFKSIVRIHKVHNSEWINYSVNKKLSRWKNLSSQINSYTQ